MRKKAAQERAGRGEGMSLWTDRLGQEPVQDCLGILKQPGQTWASIQDELWFHTLGWCMLIQELPSPRFSLVIKVHPVAGSRQIDVEK